MAQFWNFRITVTDDNGTRQFVTSRGQITVEQRQQIQKYSDEFLKVDLIVRPSRRLQTRARFTTQYVETTHALMHETDPVKDPNDWLTRPDDKVFKPKSQEVLQRRFIVNKKRTKK